MAEAIDRDDILILLDKQRTYETMEGRNRQYYKGIRDAMKIVEKAPVLHVAQIDHAKWEYIPCDGKFRAILVCSRCRRNVGEYNRFNYCPHCGAKMDLEEKQHGTDQT